jgi:phosphatidylserine/phosphatidylglycerophosphate/cardiolipin synthase-like enzyme
MPKLESYHTNIESTIVTLLLRASKSVRICMAWFTSNAVKDALLELKLKSPNVDIEVVVDKNVTNELYFYNYQEKFNSAAIKTLQNVTGRFLHNKFIVIDHYTTITGSYNTTQRAKRNIENIVVIENRKFADKYLRRFDFITKENYIDRNVTLLFKFPEFARTLISTCYPFTKKELRKYRKRVIEGECFTYNNGSFDEIRYSPGIIFNPIAKRWRGLSDEEWEFSEFKPPISKQMIAEWTKERNQNLIFDFYRGQESRYHEISDQLEQNDNFIREKFEKELANTYSYSKLRSEIKNGVDLIIERELWVNNFELYLCSSTIKGIMLMA